MLLKAARCLALACAVAGCTKETSSSSTDAADVDSALPGQTELPVVASPRWDSAFGSFIGFGADSELVVLLPTFTDSADTTADASVVNSSRVDLFGLTGHIGSATVRGLGKAKNDEGCFEFSRGQIDSPRRGWSVAFPADKASGVAVERLASLHGPDSTQLADLIKALAATVPHAQDSIWRDWPINVEDAHRFTIPGANVVVGSTSRILPGGQHYAQKLFFVGERPETAAAATPYRLAYSHSTAAFGIDDEAISGLPFEDEAGVDAVVTTKADSRPVILLETRGNEVNGFAALGRIAPGKWALVWLGPHEGGC